MRVISFPGARTGGPDAVWAAELEAALDGDAQGAAADSWRELRADVRSLAPALDPALERRLRDEIDRRTARTRRRALRARLRSVPRPLALTLTGGGIAACAAVVVLALLLPGIDGSNSRSASKVVEAEALVPSPHANGPESGALKGAASTAAVPAAVPTTSSAGESPAESTPAPGRIQQLSASLTLGTSAANIQATSDGIARLTTREGGYVASSHVQVQRGAGEANLMLKLPSAHLGAALSAIGELAPVRSQSQSLQDITNTYDATRQRLSDARAERAALLRALAKATTVGEIASLRERLSQSRSTIAHDEAALHKVSQRASNAEVEVTVLGITHTAAGGLTVRRALHDAGAILTVALAVLVIALAVLVPLALLVALLALALRRSRRYARERALADS